MKNYLFGVVIALSSLTACTDNDTEPTDPANPPMEMTLNKTVTYFPALENFTTRNVKYYENNHIVADSTYDGTGNFISRSIHTYNTADSNYTIDVKNAVDVTVAAAVEQYDAQGRLTAFFNYGQNYMYTYEGNTISVDMQIPVFGDFINVGVFTLNSDGYIASHTVLSNDIITDATSLTFSGNTQPAALMAQGTTGAMEQLGTFTYYPNAMPENLQRSTVEINNEVLKANKLEASALSGNYHLQDFSLGANSFYHSETTFNPVAGYEGYPVEQTITVNGQPFCRIYFHFSN